MRRRALYGFALLALVLAGAARADTIELTPDVQSYAVHDVLDVLEDRTGALDIVDVTKGKAASDFDTTRRGTFSFGYTDSAYWFRFAVDNPTQRANDMLLVLRSAWLDSVRLYQPDGRGGFRERGFGDRRPFVERGRTHPQFVIDLSVTPGVQTYYLRVETKEAFMSPIELWEPEAFHANDRLWAGYFGMFYGVLLVMVLYNGFIWFSIRDRSYLFYCLYLVSFFTANFSYNGFSFQYLWPESPSWANWSYATWILLFQAAGVAFAMVFMETRTRLPRMHKVLRGLLGVMLATWLLSLLSGDESFYNAVLVYFVFIYTPLVALAGLSAWLSGYRAARFFVLASMATLVGAFVTALTVTGVLPYNFVNFHAAEFGIMVDVVLLALALADRINFLRDQKETAERQVIEQQHRASALLERAKAELEDTVALRTAELARARDDAERLARLDGLTGVSNRRYFEEVAAREVSRARRYDQPLSIILFDIDLFKQVNDCHGHAVGDAVIRMVAEVARETVREVDFLARIGGEEFAVLLPGASEAQARLTAERLRERIAAGRVDIPGQSVACTASFGVTQLADHHPGFETLLQRADQLMYLSKSGGRNRVSTGGVG